MENNLKFTTSLMESEDYKDRFVAEYLQTKIRYEKLKRFCNEIEAANMPFSNVLEPKHDCPLSLLREQQHIMGEYLRVLEMRAVIENIDL